MNYPWSRTVFPIAAIFSFRMLGLFLLIPVFTLYAGKLQNATPALIGFALGSYGLTQAFLQIPFGLLSDLFSRKSIIALGLILFALGSFLGAVTDSIYGMILARCLQGTGAVGSVLIALLADLTPDYSRTKAMAVIGMTIGVSFSLAMIISPILTRYFGLAGIFYLTTFLALLGLVLLYWVIPKPRKEPFSADNIAKLSLMYSVLKNPHLQKLNAGIFCQHFILTATFFCMPLILNQLQLSQQWHFYLPLLLLAFVMMMPFIIVCEKKKLMKPLFLGSVAVTAIAQILLAFFHLHWLYLCLIFFAYFVAFNILEASLPSLVSKQASPQYKGTALGLYSTCQFFGIFAGGTAAGLAFSQWGNTGIFLINGLAASLWFLYSLSFKPNQYISTLKLPYPSRARASQELIPSLLSINGVKEVFICEKEEMIYIQIDQQFYETGSAENILASIL